MTFLHLGNLHSTNVGNGALIFGTERVLQEDLGEGIGFRREPWDDYTLSGGTKRFDQRFIDLINHESDALLVGAAVTLNGSTQYANAGMRFNLPSALWPKIRKPVIFYAISYRVWPQQRYAHLKQLRRTVADLLSHPRMLLSVRNDGTKGWLESLLGYQSERIIAIPDPALYVPTAEAVHPELVPGKTNILLSLNDEDSVHRFGGRPRELAWRCLAPVIRESLLVRAWRSTPGWAEHRRRLLKQLSRVFHRIANEWDVNLILCPHDYEDYRMMADFVSLCPPRPLHQRMISTRLERATGAPQLYDLYAKADVAVSMRVHSMVPAIGVGTPVIGLVSQARMQAFMADAGLTDFAIDIWDRAFEGRLYGLLSDLLAQRVQVTQRLQEVRAAMRARSAEFHRRIAALCGIDDAATRAGTPSSGGRVGVV